MTKLKLIHLVVIFLLLFTTAHGQQPSKPCPYSVEGTIYDLSTKEPLPFATIQLEGSAKGTVADENGYFFLNSICEEEFDLEFSHIGYKKVVHHHDIHHKLPKIYLAPDNVTLQSLIVEGEVQAGDLSSGTVSKISSKQLDLLQSESFGDIVSSISGISLMKTGQNVVKPVIHGLHSNRILIINNGVRHEFQNWGKEHAPEIDPSLSDNIEVIKGAATVRYGPDALGGVVVLNSPKLELLDPLNGEIGLTGNSNGRAVESHVRLKKGFHRVALIGEASYMRQGDLKAPNYYLTNTGKEELSLAMGAKYHIKNLDVNAYYSRFSQDLGILRGSVTGNLDDLVNAIEREVPAATGPFSYTINNPRQQVMHNMLKVDAQLVKNSSLFNMKYAFQSNQRQEYDVRRGTNNDLPSINLLLKSHTLDFDWKHSEFKGWLGTIGIQGLYQDSDNIPGTNTVPFVPNFNNYRIGLFLIESKEYEKVTLEWGLRYDYQYSSVRSSQPRHKNELNFQNFTATIGIQKDINDKSSFRSNIGSAWRPPAVSELYSFGKHQAAIEYGLFRYSFNEANEIEAGGILSEEQKEVQPEVGLKWINTYSFRKENWEAEVTGFANFIDNYIYTKPAGITQTVRGAFPYFIYDQTKALLAGFDISLLRRHSKNFLSLLTGDYLWARDVESNNYFTGLPPASIGYNFTWERPNWLMFSNTEITLGMNYTFEAFYHPRIVPLQEILMAKEKGNEIFTSNTEDFDFIPPPTGYMLVDFSWSGEMKNWMFVVKVKNLFNTEYRSYTDRLRYFADDVGRNFSMSVHYNL